MDWAQALVIILSVFLTIFLVLGIVLLIALIKISRQIKTITGSVERTVTGFEQTATNISRVTSPLYIGRFVTKKFNALRKKRR